MRTDWTGSQWTGSKRRSAGSGSGMSPEAGRCSVAIARGVSSTTRPSVPTVAGWPRHRGCFAAPVRSESTWVSLWDLETGQERLHLEVPFASSLAFSPDGRRLAGRVYDASGGEEMGEVRVWDAATGGVVLTRKFAHGRVGTMAYNGDGTLLAVSVGDVSDSGIIKVLDAETGRERLSLAGHRDTIWKLAFSPDGRRLASLASFPTRTAEVKLWDLAGGREVLTLQTTGGDLFGSSGLGDSGFAFSPDGHRLSLRARGKLPRCRRAGLGRHAAARRSTESHDGLVPPSRSMPLPSGIEAGGRVSSRDWPPRWAARLAPGNLLRDSRSMNARIWKTAGLGLSAIFLMMASAHAGDKDTPDLMEEDGDRGQVPVRGRGDRRRQQGRQARRADR